MTTLAEVDLALTTLVEQSRPPSAFRLRLLLEDSEESREMVRLIERGIPPGAGVPSGLDGIDVGIGLHAIERQIAALREKRELLVSQLPSEAALAESARRAEQQAAAQAVAASRLQNAWMNLITASETLDDCVLAVQGARTGVGPGTRVPLPDVEYVALIGGALRTLAASGGCIDDPTLQNELNAARVARAATV